MELYNLADDIGESTNLVHEKPDLAQRLKKKMDTWLSSVNADVPKKKQQQKSEENREK